MESHLVNKTISNTSHLIVENAKVGVLLHNQNNGISLLISLVIFFKRDYEQKKAILILIMNIEDK